MKDLLAKKNALMGIRKQATDAMDADLQGLKKVTVASPDEDGLEAGLDKAKELLEGEEQEEKAPEEMSLEELDEKIAYLQSCKEKLLAADSE
jgi:cbb3-type cytochrome oxidase cytochrome c subunit